MGRLGHQELAQPEGLQSRGRDFLGSFGPLPGLTLFTCVMPLQPTLNAALSGLSDLTLVANEERGFVVSIAFFHAISQKPESQKKVLLPLPSSVL